MTFDNIIVYYILLLFGVKVAVTNAVTKKTSKNSDESVKQTFAKLLKSIVKVNEERMNAVRKFTQLQDYMLTKNRLRTDDDSYDTMEEEENHVMLGLEDSPKLRRTEDEIITSNICSKLFLENNNHLWTNHFFKQACHSHSTDFCVKACTKSFRNVCENFQCSSITRRDFKTECEDNCRNVEHEEE